jgi:hypothetical protein
MRGQSAGHLAYLIRLWRVGDGEGTWHVSLQDVGTGERTGFPGLEEAFAFLQAQLSPARSPDRGPCDQERTAQ